MASITATLLLLLWPYCFCFYFLPVSRFPTFSPVSPPGKLSVHLPGLQHQRDAATQERYTKGSSRVVEIDAGVQQQQQRRRRPRQEMKRCGAVGKQSAELLPPALYFLDKHFIFFWRNTQTCNVNKWLFIFSNQLTYMIPAGSRAPAEFDRLGIKKSPISIQNSCSFSLFQ